MTDRVGSPGRGAGVPRRVPFMGGAGGCARTRSRVLWSVYAFVLVVAVVLSLSSVFGKGGGLGVRSACAQAGATGTPVPLCPGPADVGVGTAYPPAADSLSLDYVAACQHCVGGTPLPTSIYPTVMYSSPSPTPVQELVFDCPSTYVLNYQAGSGNDFNVVVGDKDLAGRRVMGARVQVAITDWANKTVSVSQGTIADPAPIQYVPFWDVGDGIQDNYLDAWEYFYVSRAQSMSDFFDLYGIGTTMRYSELSPVDVWSNQRLVFPVHITGPDYTFVYFRIRLILMGSGDVLPDCGEIPVQTNTPAPTATDGPSPTPEPVPVEVVIESCAKTGGSSGTSYDLSIINDDKLSAYIDLAQGAWKDFNGECVLSSTGAVDSLRYKLHDVSSSSSLMYWGSWLDGSCPTNMQVTGDTTQDEMWVWGRSNDPVTGMGHDVMPSVESVTDGYAVMLITVPENFKPFYPLKFYFGARQCPKMGGEVGLSYHFTSEIYEVNGVDNGGSSYATLTPTPTATPWPTPTPCPGCDADQCSVYEWANYEPVASVDFGEGDLVEVGECYTVVPGQEITLPELLGGAEIAWDSYELCINWVRFPTVGFLGLGISLDWFLLPVVGWFIKRLVHR